MSPGAPGQWRDIGSVGRALLQIYFSDENKTWGCHLIYLSAALREMKPRVNLRNSLHTAVWPTPRTPLMQSHVGFITFCGSKTDLLRTKRKNKKNLKTTSTDFTQQLHSLFDIVACFHVFVLEALPFALPLHAGGGIL